MWKRLDLSLQYSTSIKSIALEHNVNIHQPSSFSLIYKDAAHRCGCIPSYLCSNAEIIPPPPPPPPLFFPRIIMFFIFISVIEGSRRGTPMQNRASWGGIRAPEGDFFFWPWRNFSRPWNCMVWIRGEEVTGLNIFEGLAPLCVLTQGWIICSVSACQLQVNIYLSTSALFSQKVSTFLSYSIPLNRDTLSLSNV